MIQVWAKVTGDTTINLTHQPNTVFDFAVFPDLAEPLA